MFMLGRFTLRKGCVNPVIGVAFQLFAAIEKGNGLLLAYSLVLVVGAMVGGVLASLFFRDFYAPLKEGLAFEKIKTAHMEEPSSSEEEKV